MSTPEVAYEVLRAVGDDFCEVPSVVGDGFCVPYPVELIIKKKPRGLFNTRYELRDADGILFLQVDDSYKLFRRKLIMRDPAGFHILTMREKLLTTRRRWLVHRAESSERNDLLFVAQQSSFFQLKTRLDVFLASNTNEDTGNFQVVGTYFSQSCKVYKGDNVIAEVNHTLAWGNLIGRDKFRVKVYAGVDYAFVMALVILFNEIDQGGQAD